jgi:Ca2+-binding EF-hand superfamily protein
MRFHDMIRWMVTLVAFGGVGGLASSAAADGATAADLIHGTAAPRDVRPIFDQFDENKDGRVDRIEFRVWIVAAYEKLDVNNDNGLAPEELPSVTPIDFENADRNDDGRLSAFEFTDSAFMKFGRFDLNNDGFITFDEVTKSRGGGG